MPSAAGGIRQPCIRQTVHLKICATILTARGRWAEALGKAERRGVRTDFNTITDKFIRKFQDHLGRRSRKRINFDIAINQYDRLMMTSSLRLLVESTFPYCGNFYRRRAQPKVHLVSNIYANLYLSGLMYNIADLHSDESFNQPLVGGDIGLNLFNGIRRTPRTPCVSLWATLMAASGTRIQHPRFRAHQCST